MATAAAVDTRPSLGTLPRPIAAVCAVRRAPSHSHSARADEGRRAVSFSVPHRYTSLREGARRLLLPHHLTSQPSRAPRASPPSGTPVSRFLSIVWCVVRRLGAARERLNRVYAHLHDRTHTATFIKRTFVRPSGVSCRDDARVVWSARLRSERRREDRCVSRSNSFYQGKGGEEEAHLVGSCGRSWPRDWKRAVGHCAFFVSPIRSRVVCQPQCSVSAYTG